MPFLTREQLQKYHFKFLGKDVQISDKASIYNPERIEIGDYSRVDDFCVLSGKIKIGRNVHITIFCNLAGGVGGIELSDFSTVSYRCSIFTQSDDYLGNALTGSTVPKKYLNVTFGKVLVERHVIIGAHSVIFPNVTLAEGCSIGAMSLVTQSTKPWMVYVGIPAKSIKPRKKDLLLLEQQYLTEANKT